MIFKDFPVKKKADPASEPQAQDSQNGQASQAGLIPM